MTPRISIVVPTLNQGAFIEETLASIAGQQWPNLEVIVIDGGSRDDTHAIVEKYRHVVTHFVSEPDNGQAHAINKGMRLATGDILAWLNSDDYYLPLALPRAAAVLGDALTQPRLVYGDCLLLFEEQGTGKIARVKPFPPSALRTESLVFQPSAFLTRALWDKTGGLTEKYHFVLDWDFWIRAAAHGEFVVLNKCLSVFRFYQGHKTGSGDPRRLVEVFELIEKNATPREIAAFHAVAARLRRMSATWDRFAVRGGYRWHKLLHLDLYARYGEMVDKAFWQLHV
jgi:glycosyltransferase involved in cell wall biosynthesis